MTYLLLQTFLLLLASYFLGAFLACTVKRAIMGSRQSGAPLLRFADLDEDAALLAQARRLAPTLLREHPQAAAAHVQRWLGGRADYLRA